MRLFGWIFVVVGLALAVISVKAVLDPNTIFEGWERFQEDPWAQGIVIGGILALAGGLLLVMAPQVGPRTRLSVGRALAVLVFGFIGFALFAPFGVTTGCFDGPTGGGCETQSWSTITGLTFDGDVFYTPALVAGAVFSTGTFLFLARRSPGNGKGMAGA